jgi:hypothetical protein
VPHAAVSVVGRNAESPDFPQILPKYVQGTAPYDAVIVIDSNSEFLNGLEQDHKVFT